MNSKYIIAAETGADLPSDLISRYNIYIAPMHVSFGTVTKDDGSFPITEVFDYYKKAGELPHTSGCNIEDFTRILDKIHEEHPDKHIIYLAYSAVTTCSYQSAVLAAEGRDYFTPFDTKQVSAGQALIILMMARYLEEHPEAELPEILKKAEEYRDRCHMGFFPGDLAYLRAGGRVSNAAYIGAKILSLNPLIELIDGRLIGTKKYRGSMEKVAGKLLKDFAAANNLSREILFFPYSYGFSDKARAAIEAQAREMGFQEIRWIQTGSVVSTHSGPGAYGVCGLTARP